MPLNKITIQGKVGYRWGEHGKIYFGPNGRARAWMQGKAIKVSQIKSHYRSIRGRRTFVRGHTKIVR